MKIFLWLGQHLNTRSFLNYFMENPCCSCEINFFLTIKKSITAIINKVSKNFSLWYEYFLGQTFQDPSELFQFVRKDAVNKKYFCTLCEQFSHHGRNMARNHVESKHFPNTFSYPCDLCGEVLLSKSNFMTHRSRKHLNKNWYIVWINRNKK